MGLCFGALWETFLRLFCSILFESPLKSMFNLKERKEKKTLRVFDRIFLKNFGFVTIIFNNYRIIFNNYRIIFNNYRIFRPIFIVLMRDLLNNVRQCLGKKNKYIWGIFLQLLVTISQTENNFCFLVGIEFQRSKKSFNYPKNPFLENMRSTKMIKYLQVSFRDFVVWFSKHFKYIIIIL